MYWVKIFGGFIFRRSVHLNKIIYLPGNGVKISEIKISEACSVSENLTLPKISRLQYYREAPLAF